MNVADAMTPRSEVVTAELPGTRDDVLERFQEGSFSSVPVIKPGENGEAFRGLVSRSDLIERPDEDQLALLMQEVPTTLGEASIEELAELMLESGARRVPVVDGRLEGIITVTDVVRAIADGAMETTATVEDVLEHDINTTYLETPLPVAEREISYANVPYTIALDEEGDMAGVLTEVDVIEVARVVEGEDETGESMAGDDDDWKWESVKAVGNRYLPTRDVEMPAGPVRDFMTADVVSISERKTVQEAAQTMISNDIEQIPVVSGDELVGIVRDVSLLEALL